MVEEKPEAKKAGGVYYTPIYIVDYIVKNTVGKIIGADPLAVLKNVGSGPRTVLDTVGAGPRACPNEDDDPHPDKGAHRGTPLQNMTPKQISKIRILDPACGSGSFLIGAYTYLLNYHRDWYVKDGPG